jgi:hypothetical protein
MIQKLPSFINLINFFEKKKKKKIIKNQKNRNFLKIQE